MILPERVHVLKILQVFFFKELILKKTLENINAIRVFYKPEQGLNRLFETIFLNESY